MIKFNLLILLVLPCRCAEQSASVGSKSSAFVHTYLEITSLERRNTDSTVGIEFRHKSSALRQCFYNIIYVGVYY